MSEPSLSIQFKELQARVGTFLGWGRGAAYGDTAWTSAQQFELDGIIGSALRKFYHQALPDGMQVAYDWSFLHPTATFSFLRGSQTVPVPEDFGGSEGQVSCLTSSTTSQPWRIEWRNEGQIQQMYAYTPQRTGPPMFVAEQPIRGTGATQGQRRQLLIFPIADADYTLQMEYYINPDFLSGAFPYAYGGSQHAETILEGCLAVAERRLDDSATVHAMEYERCLQASISIDRRNKPQVTGYNADRSDQKDGYSRWPNHWWPSSITYDGNPFS